MPKITGISVSSNELEHVDPTLFCVFESFTKITMQTKKAEKTERANLILYKISNIYSSDVLLVMIHEFKEFWLEMETRNSKEDFNSSTLSQ